MHSFTSKTNELDLSLHLNSNFFPEKAPFILKAEFVELDYEDMKLIFTKIAKQQLERYNPFAFD